MHYHFTDVYLDLDQHALKRAGQRVKVRPKVFDVLVYLIEHRDRVVSKDELLQQLWPDRYIGQTTLSSCIKELRQAVGDNGREQCVVQTLHRRGYRFIATLQRQDDVEVAAIPSPSSLKQALVETTESEQQTTAPASEHKVVSVFSCGLENASDIAERLGSENMDRVMQRFFSIAQDIVARFDGYVTQCLGDGFIVLFGTQQAHEDHARRAVLAALELIHRHPISSRNSARICVGVHSGSAVISHLQNDPQQLYTALGVTTLTADELKHRASADTLLISAVTYRLVQAHVQATPVGAAGEKMDAFRVERIISSRAGVPRRIRRTLTPLVGRDWELALLRERLSHVCEG